MITVIHAGETPPETYNKAIFLAGPSPRGESDGNWRPEALETLEKAGYDGVVYVPLPREEGKWPANYEDQVEWETKYLHMSDIVVFWVPRDLESLPAFTTNVEFGLWVSSGKAVYGRPPQAPKNRYLDWHAKQESVQVFDTLESTLNEAINKIGKGAERTGGEREVPLFIWNLPHFQSWLWAQKLAGNRLDGARVLFNFRVGQTGKKNFPFAFILHVNVFIASENRNKTNEFIFSRPDIATVVGYRKTVSDWMGPHAMREPYNILETEIAIIREFRSPARTTDGFIREIPGGSSWKPGDDPFVTMTHELEEETGLGAKSGFDINPKRLRKIGSRQLCGTLSAHQAHVFACELNEAEMDFMKKQQAENTVHGVLEDTERTYVEIHRLGDLLKSDRNDLDWSMLGQILTALMQ